MDSEGLYKLENRFGSLRQREAEQEGCGDAAEDLLQQQQHAVLVPETDETKGGYVTGSSSR